MNQESGIKAKKNKIISIIHDSLFMIHSKGFTLIELMVALSITAILGVLGIAGFVNYNEAQVLQTSANEVVTMLNLAKSRAQSQVKLGSKCNGQVLDGYRVSIRTSSSARHKFVLMSECAGVTSDLDTKTLPQNVSFNATTHFFFPVQKGGVETEGSIIISSGGKTKTITVNALGGVSVR